MTNLLKDLARVLGTHLIAFANTPDTPVVSETPAQAAVPVVPAPIVRVPVDSSMITSVGHRQSDDTLEVEFVGARIYQYANVSEDAFLDLIEARSIGQHFNKYIRDYYTFTEIKGDKS